MTDAKEELESVEIDLQHIFRILRKNWRLIAASFLLAVLLGGLVTWFSPPRYRAAALVIVRRVDVPLQVLGLPQELSALLPSSSVSLANYLEIARSYQVLAKLKDRLANDPLYVSYTAQLEKNPGDPNPSAFTPDIESLKRAITVRQVTNGNIIRIEAVARHADEAALLANHMVEAFREVERQMSMRSLQAVIAFLDRQIEEARVQLGLSTEELVKLAQRFGMALETSAYTAKLSRLEQLLAEARVELEDARFQLQTVNNLLDQLRQEILERFGGPEGAALLSELIDKLTLIRQIQRQILAWEQERSRYLEEGNFIKAKELENRIKSERQKMETTAATQYKLLESLPRYEELITQQFQLELKIVALENRVRVLEDQRQQELEILLSHGLELTRAKREVDVGEQLYILLVTQYAKSRLAEAAELGSIEPLDYAVPPKSPESPRLLMNLMVSAVLGLFGGGICVLARQSLRRTFFSEQEIEEFCKAPVVGIIPYLSAKKLLLTNFEPNTPEYEAFLALSSSLRFLSLDQPPKSVVITSAEPGAGKTLVSTNLALARAMSNQRVLLVEGDFRRPALGKILGISNDKGPGLTDVAVGNVPLSKAVQKLEFPSLGLVDFLPSGQRPPNPADFFGSQTFAQVFQRLAEVYDFVVIDVPPLLVSPDAALLASVVDVVLLVLEAEKTTRQEVRAALRMLRQHRANLHGVVLNKVTRNHVGYGYYYYYHEKRGLLQSIRHALRRLRFYKRPHKPKARHKS